MITYNIILLQQIILAIIAKFLSIYDVIIMQCFYNLSIEIKE